MMQLPVCDQPLVKRECDRDTQLHRLGELGIVVWVELGQLQYAALREVLTTDLEQLLTLRSRELVKHLSSPDSIGLHPGYINVRLSTEVQVLHRRPNCSSGLWWQHTGGQHACLLCHPPTHLVTVATTNYLGVIPSVDWQSSH